MKIWLDDLRLPPDGWVWKRTSQEICSYDILASIKNGEVEEISFDHDLGELSSKNGYQVLCLIEELIAKGYIPRENIPQIHIHTANPVGYKNLSAARKSIQKLSL